MIDDVIKLLWSLHHNEDDDEDRAWNGALDLAIARLEAEYKVNDMADTSQQVSTKPIKKPDEDSKSGATEPIIT